MLKCMRVADFIETQVIALVERFVETVKTVCRDVVEQIEEWETRWEEQCETVQRRVCRWLPWPLNKLCEWVTETVCNLVQVAVKVVKTIVRTVCEVVTSLIKILVLVPLTIILVVFRVVCFIIDFIISWVKIFIWAIVGIPEFLSCLLGLRIRKHIHVCVTVLADSRQTPVVSDADVDTVLAEAEEIISRRFDVHLHVHGRKLVQVPDDRLDVTACDAGQLFSADAFELTKEGNRGGSFDELFGCGDNLVDLAGEIVHDVLNIIFIRDIIEGDDVGCHIPGTDYVIVDQSASGLVLAHEVGHACDLWHVSERDNLMNHIVRDDQVHRWQVCIFRRSRFVVYAP